jgi:uncharacterized protein YndB with AHSA1/START domain
MRSLFYIGPPIKRLHQQYAKQGRIDERAAVTTTCEIVINAPVQLVWKLIANPAGWPDFYPVIHDVKTDAPRSVDSTFTWASGRSHFQSRFAVLDTDREVTWTGTAAWLKVIHRHLLDTTADGATRVRCEESMSGLLLGLLYSRAKLQADLMKWLTAVQAGAERQAAGPAPGHSGAGQPA